VASRPFEQVLEEVEQARVGPLHVLEHEDRRRLLPQTLEQDPPGREEVLMVAGRPLLESQQMSEPRLDPAALLRIGDVLLDRRVQLRERESRLLVLDDAAAHPHHLRQRPVRHTLAVGEAAAAMPEDVVREPVDVLLELPREARLADAGDARDRHELRLPLVRRAVEQLLDETKLAITTNERSLEPGRAQRPPSARDHTKRPPERHRLGLSLQLVASHVFVGDRRLRRTLRRLADQNHARLGRRLDTRGRVDQIACHETLRHAARHHRRLTSENAGPGLQPRRPHLLAESGHDRDQVERGPHRTLRIVLLRHRRPPNRHHRVTDELLDRTAIPLDHRPRLLEVP
jgi:hypothetical protein